jgi:hypothetical protein
MSEPGAVATGSQLASQTTLAPATLAAIDLRGFVFIFRVIYMEKKLNRPVDHRIFSRTNEGRKNVLHANSTIRFFGSRAVKLLKKRIPAAFLITLVLIVLIPYLLKYLGRGAPVLESPTASKALGVKEFIADLKSELSQLEEERNQKNEAAVFDIVTFDLEISFMVRASSQQKAGVEYQIVTADSEIQNGIEKIQKLTVHMKPIGNQKIPDLKTGPPSEDNSATESVIDRPPPMKGTKP